ncbi:type I-C CRISPR-associated protein Cas7/Csd2 [Corallococcus sp. CA053C]|uniref:type I-C CRISPR-associated protein Cas7/Csd2 n=1 Tax=Corallococcus sp. CA053C TaxID=2316732 RepID=UPI000EA30BD8|nr:type I-C CRISPR-associated protein Cas7/Csd2 [Corallococcus sp. CA053C]RKH15204.1 type I-C CRISPR-associated protein Cas7/Csd2 [Corallococcus sp. CA053C]
MSEIKNRYDFVLLFDVKDGNPNGDPDAGNLPRFDPETGHGLVTDVCLKRKVRNYVQLVHSNADGYDIYVKERAVLSALHAEAYTRLGLKNQASGDEASAEPVKAEGKSKAEKKPRKATEGDVVRKVRDEMCRRYFDVRTFGAVMALREANAGQVRGPVQLTFGRSLDPVVAAEHTITRMAVATQKEADNQGGDNRTMGRKTTVPYGLYRAHGFVSPALARQTAFGEADLELLWKALVEMFDHDRSAARGLMATRRLLVFRHASELGNAPAHKLFDTVGLRRKDEATPPRDFSDYALSVSSVPPGVEVVELGG